jgi:ribonuclease P protein component
MIGRLLRKVDFERLLGVLPCSRSAHFAVHYVRACPSPAKKHPRQASVKNLSTDDSPTRVASVDDLVLGHWLGSVIPKRHASRSVTRNLLRRQIREAVQRHETRLRPGLWLVRLRQPFSTAQFSSAASPVLKISAASELERLLLQAGQ